MHKEALKYWIPTTLFCFALGGSGAMNAIGHPEAIAEFTKLGFPAWLTHWIGAWKLAGVAVLLAPGLARWKEWAMAGFTISLTSATAAHVAAGEEVGESLFPLILLAIGLAGYAMRPASRRLG